MPTVSGDVNVSVDEGFQSGYDEGAKDKEKELTNKGKL